MNTSSQQERPKIAAFEGEFHFLSNFYPAVVEYRGRRWWTTEAAYQAMKTINEEEQNMLQMVRAPALAKRLGKTVAVRRDWDEIKEAIMREIVQAKFDQNAFLQDMLLATEDAIIEEGNWWGDTFWGICKGQGLNKLGNILMELRDGYLGQVKKENI